MSSAPERLSPCLTARVAVLTERHALQCRRAATVHHPCHPFAYALILPEPGKIFCFAPCLTPFHHVHLFSSLHRASPLASHRSSNKMPSWTAIHHHRRPARWSTSSRSTEEPKGPTSRSGSTGPLWLSSGPTTTSLRTTRPPASSLTYPSPPTISPMAPHWCPPLVDRVSPWSMHLSELSPLRRPKSGAPLPTGLATTAIVRHAWVPPLSQFGAEPAGSLGRPEWSPKEQCPYSFLDFGWAD
jgi:hypothetical protein